MARHPQTEKEVERFVDYNDELDPYPSESALVFLNCVSDYEISDTERCKILERALADVLKRLEFLEAQAPQEPAKVSAADARRVRELSGANLKACCDALRQHNGKVREAADALKQHGLA